MDISAPAAQLAGTVYLGGTGFYETFRDVMHLSPLQYAKPLKLDRAHALLKGGENAGEAEYLASDNRLAQFSRE